MFLNYDSLRVIENTLFKEYIISNLELNYDKNSVKQDHNIIFFNCNWNNNLESCSELFQNKDYSRYLGDDVKFDFNSGNFLGNFVFEFSDILDKRRNFLDCYIESIISNNGRVSNNFLVVKTTDDILSEYQKIASEPIKISTANTYRSAINTNSALQNKNSIQNKNIVQNQKFMNKSQKTIRQIQQPDMGKSTLTYPTPIIISK